MTFDLDPYCLFFQVVLVDYFQLQMSAHHPCGAQTEHQGAFAVNWELWKVNYHQISNISVYHLVLQLSLPNPLKPGAKLGMKM